MKNEKKKIYLERSLEAVFGRINKHRLCILKKQNLRYIYMYIYIRAKKKKKKKKKEKKAKIRLDF